MLLLSLVGIALGSPTTTSPIIVNYEGSTTTPPLVNYRLSEPSPSAIYLRTDKEAEAELMRLTEDPSGLMEKSLVLNRDEDGDDNSTIHVETSEDRIVGGEPAELGELPMKARLSLAFTNIGSFR